MRIITGKYGGRKIHPPAKMPFTRPTTDIAKEGLFNVLQNNMDIDGISTLDLFGGTGSISYELASRGANNLTIVEKDSKMYSFIKNKIKELQIDNARVIQSDVFRFLETASGAFDFIFAGPPYALQNIDEIPILIFDKQLLKPDGWFVLEHTPRNNYESNSHFRGVRKYGTTLFSIFKL